MTSYYKGNNIGLNYDAANATWSFTNEPNDFIDPASFSTAEPAFDYTPPPSQDDDEEDTTCPPGYIYDETLKQCVPDPNYQAPAFSGEPGGDGGYQPDEQNYVDFREMSYDEMVDFGKKKGFFNEAGTFIGAPKSEVPFPFLKGIAQFGLDSQANRFAINFAKKGGKIWNPLEESFIGNLYIPQRNDLARLIEGKETFDISSDYNKKIKDFETATLNTASKISGYRYAEDQETQNLIDQQISQKNKFNLLKQQAAAEKAKLQAEQERLKVKAEKDKMQQIIRDAEKKEEEKKKEKEYLDTFSGGDSQGGEFATTPKKDTKPKAPPGQPDTGPHIGYGGGGTSSGASVHGSGSYTPSQPSSSSSSGAYSGPRKYGR